LGSAETAAIQEVIAYYRERRLDPGYQGEFEEAVHGRIRRANGRRLCRRGLPPGTAALFCRGPRRFICRKAARVIVSPITDPGSLAAITLNRLVPRLADFRAWQATAWASSNSSPALPRMFVLSWLCIRSVRRVNVSAIVREAHARGIRVIEDCSQAPWRPDSMAVRSERSVIIAAFSAMYRKAHIAGGSGGIVYTRDPRSSSPGSRACGPGQAAFGGKRLQRLRSELFSCSPRLNLHTDEISCGIGLASLARLQDTIMRRLVFVRGADRKNARPLQGVSALRLFAERFPRSSIRSSSILTASRAQRLNSPRQ